jgi:hypothetical protein
MLGSLAALGCSGILAMDPSPLFQERARGVPPLSGVHMGDSALEASRDLLAFRSLQLPAVGMRPLQREAGVPPFHRSKETGVHPALGPARGATCAIRLVHGEALADQGLVHPAPPDVDPGIVRPSGCAE